MACLNPLYHDLFAYQGKQKDKHDREHEVYLIKTLCPVPEIAEKTILEPKPFRKETTTSTDAPADYSQGILQQLQLLMVDALGPIAPVLINRAAKGERSLRLLCDSLASQIVDTKARIRFIDATQKILDATQTQSTGSPTTHQQRSFHPDPEKIKKLTDIFSTFVGPIAPMLVKKRVGSISSYDELIDILEKEVSTTKEKDAFRLAAIALFQ